MKIITEQSYPANIAVITSDAMESAVAQASIEMKKPHIQGVVWKRGALIEPLGSAEEIQLYADRIPDTKGAGHSRKELAQYFMAQAGKDTFSSNLEARCAIAMALLARLSRVDRLVNPEAVPSVTRDARFIAINDATNNSHGNYHIDGAVFARGRNDDMLPFGGKSVRVIFIDQGEGMHILDPKDIPIDVKVQFLETAGSQSKPVPEELQTAINEVAPWEMEEGDVCFFKNKLWGPDQALIHKIPTFKSSDPSIRRVTTIYGSNM
tara:strand:+ start:485 stop:1279 length:795 start_codon:yes stop_codon:yes gene_type:complete